MAGRLAKEIHSHLASAPLLCAKVTHLRSVGALLINTTLHAATGPGKCYYVDKNNGDDTNPGTFDQPWASYLKFVSYYKENLDGERLNFE